jgi:hypothetical protein
MSNDTFEPISSTTATIEQARSIVYKVLRAENAEQDYPRLAHALQKWTWTTLATGRDGQLVEWHELLRSTATFLEGRDDKAAVQVLTLANMLEDSIRAHEAHPQEALAAAPSHRKVAEALAAFDGRATRTQLLEHTEMHPANFTAAMNRLGAHRMVNVSYGADEEPIYSLASQRSLERLFEDPSKWTQRSKAARSAGAAAGAVG